jgi:quercetin dioxygenase-like cupin family protein
MADPVLDIQAAEVVLACADINDTLEFFRDQLGFKLITIFPSDDPQVAVLSGFGVSIRLNRNHQGEPGTIRLLSDDPDLIGTTMTAPNGTEVVFGDAHPKLVIPPPTNELVISKLNDASRNRPQWSTGRAGMKYRDLVPSRLGGHIIASHIAIPHAGPVGDYVHYHKVHFQMIFCFKGSVKVLYEDNGGLLTINPGDCFLQPPEIRHRVMESSDGLEVIEVTCPSNHMTFPDNDMDLPNGPVNHDKTYGGQKFVHHIAENAPWTKWRLEGFEARDVEICKATNGVADVKVARPVNAPVAVKMKHDCPMLFSFVLAGNMDLDGETLEAGDSFVMPPDREHEYANFSSDLQLLEVALPAGFKTTIL